MNVGFIGLGAMGMPMARNLATKLNVRPRVYDANPKALDAAAPWATVCTSPRDVASGGGIVISMLPADPHVRAVALGPDGIIASGARDLVFADFSTIGPDTIRSVAAQLSENGIRTIGGACTLGVAAAEKGTLAIYLEGEKTLVDEFDAVFAGFSQTSYYIGELGHAKLIKLMNNYFAALNVALTAEALALGVRAGLDLRLLVDILQKGSADSFVLRNHFGTSYLNDDIGPGKFGVDYMIKDLGILSDYCRSTTAPLMMGAVALSLYRGASAAGYGKHYYPVLLRWLQETTGGQA